MGDIATLKNMLTDIIGRKKNNIIEFKSELNNLKKQNNRNIFICIKLFNNTIMKICETVLDNVKSDLFLITYSKTLDELIKTEPGNIIMVFIKNIYSINEYRNNIKVGNEQFFINENFKNAEVDKIFQFKKVWKILKLDTKDYIKKAMKTLLNISEQFIKLKADEEDLNKMEKI